MRIRVHFEAGNLGSQLYQIAWQLEHGRTYGAGWCVRSGEDCPVPESKRQLFPCEGNVLACRGQQPIARPESMVD
jgi:hypothetical protein